MRTFCQSQSTAPHKEGLPVADGCTPGNALWPSGHDWTPVRPIQPVQPMAAADGVCGGGCSKSCQSS